MARKRPEGRIAWLAVFWGCFVFWMIVLWAIWD
nr:YmiA family putative membrane protein [Enterobacter asburiae]